MANARQINLRPILNRAGKLGGTLTRWCHFTCEARPDRPGEVRLDPDRPTRRWRVFWPGGYAEWSPEEKQRRLTAEVSSAVVRGWDADAKAARARKKKKKRPGW